MIISQGFGRISQAVVTATSTFLEILFGLDENDLEISYELDELIFNYQSAESEVEFEAADNENEIQYGGNEIIIEVCE